MKIFAAIVSKTKNNPMRPKKSFVFALLLLASSGLLGGCGPADQLPLPSAESPQQMHPAARVQQAQEFRKSVDLHFDARRQEQEASVSIWLSNPEQKPITSVESWLSFNPEAVEVLSVDLSQSAFRLQAPYGQQVDAVQGLIRVGAGNNPPLTSVNLPVAEVRLRLLKPGALLMDTFSYQPDLSGHVSANAVVQGQTYNLLRPPASPAVALP